MSYKSNGIVVHEEITRHIISLYIDLFCSDNKNHTNTCTRTDTYTRVCVKVQEKVPSHLFKYSF